MDCVTSESHGRGRDRVLFSPLNDRFFISILSRLCPDDHDHQAQKRRCQTGGFVSRYQNSGDWGPEVAVGMSGQTLRMS